MKLILQILLFILAYKCGAQTTINNVSLDTLGRLKWNVTFLSPQLEIEIQRNLLGKWITVSKTGSAYSVIEFVGQTNPSPATIETFNDSCIVPLDRGVNKYRIIMTAPVRLESQEVTVGTMRQTQ
jgi:hypothetical protein